MSYIINTRTFYIMFDGKKTIINEYGTEFVFDGDIINEILENSCIYYGSTLKGRIIGSKNLINSRYKLPIIINDRKNLIFFKIKSKKEVIWFNFNKIKDYKKYDMFITIDFINNYSKKFMISWSIFNNQILKSSRLLMVYLAHGKY